MTGWMARRALPAGAESFGALFLGFLTLDVFGAENAGWLGDLSAEGFTVLLGSVLLVAGLGTAYAAARAAVPALVGAQLVGVAGAALVAAGGYALADFRTVVLVAAVVGTGALAVAARTPAPDRRHLVRRRLSPSPGGSPCSSTARPGSGPAPTLAGVWGDLDAWPLLVAAALAAAPAALPRLPLEPPARRAGDRRHDRGVRRRGARARRAGDHARPGRPGRRGRRVRGRTAGPRCLALGLRGAHGSRRGPAGRAGGDARGDRARHPPRPGRLGSSEPTSGCSSSTTSAARGPCCSRPACSAPRSPWWSSCGSPTSSRCAPASTWSAR